jgi:hypothetical protein
MTYTHFWLLLFAIGIAGCEKAQPATPPADAGKEQAAQGVKAPPVKSAVPFADEKAATGVSRTADMPSYHWPADFKLPLVINIETPDVPKEIQGPSPPIEEEKKPVEEETKAIGDEKK